MGNWAWFKVIAGQVAIPPPPEAPPSVPGDDDGFDPHGMALAIMGAGGHAEEGGGDVPVVDVDMSRTCEECGARFRERTLKSSHMFAVLRLRRFRCTVCEHSSPKKANVLRHISRVHQLVNEPPREEFGLVDPSKGFGKWRRTHYKKAYSPSEFMSPMGRLFSSDWSTRG
ncbi:unnamed protein product [Allacma fusca]|uniref:C2H2-type domain-containing protein n=1 Tax=Allacma fusca TaxID=39272 RepID=A0A8J2PQV7_9HEXA|nr:unnamed protein product [Allacma fusca]